MLVEFGNLAARESPSLWPVLVEVEQVMAKFQSVLRDCHRFGELTTP